MRSDAFSIDTDGGLRLVESRTSPPVVTLDKRYYTGLDEFERRFPQPVGLVECDRLRVEGDVTFGRGVVVRGEVTLRAREQRATVADGTRFDSGIHDLTLR